MTYDSVFDSTENQALLAVCARKTIRTAAIAGIVWGAINLVIGFFAVRSNPLNAGIVVLGLLMSSAGVSAIRKPSLESLRIEALVSILLLCWNAGIATLNARTGRMEGTDGHGLIFPAIAAIVFFRQYRRLGHLRNAISGMNHGMVKEATTVCKQLFKSKLKQSPDVVQATSKRYRVRLMNDSIFCAQRNLRHAFQMSREHFGKCIGDLTQKRLSVVVRHPLGKIAYKFGKKDSDKIKSWLTVSGGPTV
jgi:hypothetical protein